MILITNISDVVKIEISRLRDLANPDLVTRSAAFDTVALISDRVQQEGKKSDNSAIQSFYSAGYAKKRAKNGLQTGFVDLTFTGDMLNDFLPVQENGDWGVGFIGDRNADKARWNEERFGTIFELSQSELKLIELAILNNINKILS
jgi:hypothetical protein